MQLGILTGEDLKDSSEEESSSLIQGEELPQEKDQRQQAEDCS